MKYKYTGHHKAVIYINDRLVDVVPGEIVEGINFPKSHFSLVTAAPKPKTKKKPKVTSEDKQDATETSTSSLRK